jgi:hypothetical protein
MPRVLGGPPSIVAHLARRGVPISAVALGLVICQAQGILMERYRIDAQ